MRPPLPRPILLLFHFPSHRHFSSAATPQPLPASPFRRHRNDEESKATKVTVWWDFENCQIPSGVSAYRIAHRITSALRSHGIKGPITITATGDVSLLNNDTQVALCTTGICLNHVPQSGKNSADKSILAHLVGWVAQNPPPAHLFLISGDRDFANILHRLRMNNYNILIASSDGASNALFSAATIMWRWNKLVKGENLTGRYFNHPPDGAHGSWYGYCKGVLDDPFADGEDDIRNRPLPKILLKKLRDILSSNPEGVPITDLYKELKKSGVVFDKDFWGHKKFSSLISALASIATVKAHPSSEIVGNNAYEVSPQEPTVFPVGDNNGDKGEASTTECDDSSYGHESQPPVEEELGTDDNKQSAPASQSSVVSYTSVEDRNSSYLTTKATAKAEDAVSSPHGDNNSDAASAELDVSSSSDSKDDAKSEIPVMKEGFLQRIWRMIKRKAVVSVDDPSTSENSSQPLSEENFSKEFEKSELKGEASLSLFSNPQFWDSMESFFHTSKGLKITSNSMTRTQLVQKLRAEGPVSLNPLSDNDISQLVDLLISQKKWVEEHSFHTFPFKLTLPAERSCVPSDAHGLKRSTEFFSSEMLGNSDSHEAKRQEDLDQNPSNGDAKIDPPKNLEELKTWYHKMSGGSSMITASDFKEDFRKKFGRELDPQFYGYYTAEGLRIACSTNNSADQIKEVNVTMKPRKEMVSHCQKLVMQALEETPAGLELHKVKTMFKKRYGYDLDHKSLGHSKLSDMLDAIPGVRVRYSLVLPDRKTRPSPTKVEGVNNKVDPKAETKKCTSVDETKGALDFGEKVRKGRSIDVESSSWEELGPLTSGERLENDNSQKESVQPLELDEVSLSDEDFTDTEDSASNGTHGLEKTKGTGVAGSSLLQILESWHNSKGVGGWRTETDEKKSKDVENKNQPAVGDTLVDCSANNSTTPAEPKTSDTETSSNFRRKPTNKYNFVVESEDEKDKVTSEILHLLKK